MRIATMTLTLLIAVLGNSWGGTPVKDPRLAQKVTYRVRLKPIAEITADLTKLTKVTFTAGRSHSDWRVREDCATVIAKDVPMATLMDSIAHALKFRWVRTGTAPNYSYRLTEDPVAIAAMKSREDGEKKRRAKERQEAWDKALAVSAMSTKELESIRDSDPTLYLSAKAGCLQPQMDFLRRVPEAKESFLKGEPVKLAGRWLSPEARRLAVDAVGASLRFDAQIYNQQAKDTYEAEIAKVEEDPMRIVVEIDGRSLSVNGIPCMSLSTSGNEASRLFGLASVKAYEQKRPWTEVYAEMKPQIRAAATKENEKRQASRPQIGCDPGVTHPADPVLARQLKDKAESAVITGMVASLADASGFAIVTADVRGRNRLSFDKGVSVREPLDKIAANWGCNWNRNGLVLELWRADWYRRRNARVSKVWLEAMKKKFREQGTYDIDELAQIMSLTQEQFWANRESLLPRKSGFLTDRAMECLRFYASLGPDQRSALFSDFGLSFESLALDQQKSVVSQLRGINIPMLPSLALESLGIRVNCTRERRGKAWLYKFSAYTRLGQFPGHYSFTTPLYIPPPPPKPTPAGAAGPAKSAILSAK